MSVATAAIWICITTAVAAGVGWMFGYREGVKDTEKRWSDAVRTYKVRHQ